MLARFQAGREREEPYLDNERRAAPHGVRVRHHLGARGREVVVAEAAARARTRLHYHSVPPPRSTGGGEQADFFWGERHSRLASLDLARNAYGTHDLVIRPYRVPARRRWGWRSNGGNLND